MRLIAVFAAAACVASCGPASDVLDPIAQWLASRFEAFRVPSGSMLPTLRISDNFFVDKSAYRSRDPTRGEVIVFDLARDGSNLLPVDKSPDSPRERFISRVIAIPGDVVETRDGNLFINGSRIPEQGTDDKLEIPTGEILNVSIQELDTGPFLVARNAARKEYPIQPTKVPANRYFVLGDNRNDSRDSRFWGTVPKSSILGPATGVYWSDGFPTWRRINP